MTGNGTNLHDSRASALGDSIIKLRSNLSVLDWFTPFNDTAIANTDADLGSSGAMLIPGTDMLMGGGKESKFYLMHKNAMGHFNPNNNSQIVQDFYVSPPPDPAHPLANVMTPGLTHHIHGGPVYWNGPKGPWIYIWTENDCLKAFHLVNGRFDTTPMKCTTVPSSDCVGMPGGALSISANGSAAGSGIVWASHPYRQNVSADANQHVVRGILRAYDASDLSNELWNSEENSALDIIGNFAKFCPPTVANGKVYLASFGSDPNGTDKSTYHFSVYGLEPTA
jgi:hypothetical protein